ncbi:unnamed protein product [Closterium sp. Naga37s-1]|nr:unnamed protein product [Closterium sp. Naga37s-1]
MQGRVGDGPGGVGACFVGGLLSMPVPSTHRSFRYSGSRPRTSGQTRTTTRTDSVADEEEEGDDEGDDEGGDEGEGEEEEEDKEGSGDDSEPGWTPRAHGGAGDGGGDEDEEMEGLEPEGVEEGVGEGGGVAAAAAEEASQHVGRKPVRGGGGVKKGGKAEGRGAAGSGKAGIKSYMSKKLSEVELRQAIAKLVVTCDLPFKIVEAKEFRELLILCNQHCGQNNFIPSCWTVARDTVAFSVAALHAAKAEIQRKEGELGCKVSYTTDIWTAPNGKAWLVVTGHWIDESFQLREALLEFRELPGRHGIAQIAQIVEDMVVMWGLEGRCLGLTTDNASANIAAYRRLSEEGGGQAFFNSRLHFRCVSHVVNLAVQAGLKVEAVHALLKVLRDMASWHVCSMCVACVQHVCAM